jgi:hypothetical protein
MTHVLALLAGIAGAAAGFLFGLVAGGILSCVLGLSGFEGGAGFFAVAIGIGTGFIGLILGIVVVLRKRGRYRRFGAVVGHTAAILLAMGGLATAGVFARLAMVEHYDGASPQLHFEIRLPANAAIPERKAVEIELNTDKNATGAVLADTWLRRDGDRPVIAGMIPLYLKTSQRIVVLSLPGEPKRLFTLSLSRTPKPAPNFGDWRRVDFIDDPRDSAGPQQPGKKDDFEIRIRVPDWTRPYIPMASCEPAGQLCS